MDYYEAQQQNAHDEFLDALSEELYDEHKDRAINEFVDKRLKSYYLKNKDIAIDVISFIKKSKDLLETEPTSSLMYSSIATEVILKSLLLKPIVFGLVHTESLADLVSSMLIKQTGIDRFKKLVFEILENHIDFENGFENFIRKGSKVNLWLERKNVHEIRNRIMHQAIFCSKDEAELSYSIAITYFYLTKLLIENVGFKIEDNGKLLSIE